MEKNNLIPLMRGNQVPREQQGKHRVGIIPYCIVKKKVWICLGIDKQSGDITDFGGGLKKNESIVSGALREFKEESGTYFQDLKLSPDYLENVLCIHSSSIKMTIFFLPVPRKKRIASVPLSDEMRQVKWIDFHKIFDHGPLYSKFHNFLKEVSCYLPVLSKILTRGYLHVLNIHQFPCV